MSYTPLDSPPTVHHSSNNPTNFPASGSQSFFMKLPQLHPRELKNIKISNQRRRRLLLSYLPDWYAISPSFCQAHPNAQSYLGSFPSCLRTLGCFAFQIASLIESPPQRRILRSGQDLWFQARVFLGRYLVSPKTESTARECTDICPDSLRHP